jgi:triphosphoribosyl-dephospho-CoA synthetase
MTVQNLTARCCKECGMALSADRDYRAEVCGSACRTAWSNRRKMRGAELYDLFMAMRHERGAAKALGIWNLMCRMAAAWKQEDMDERAGRLSYAPPKVAVENSARYRSTIYKLGR